MSTMKITDQNFQTEVINAERPVLVDFYADWCGPCKAVAPVIEELASELEGKAHVCKLNVDQGQEIAAQYNVMSIPTLIVFNKGKKVEQTIGAVPKETILNMIQKYI